MNGKQYPLGVTDPDAQSAALDALRALLASLEHGKNAAPGTVGEAVAGYVASLAGRPATSRAGQLHYCRKFAARYCTELAASLSVPGVQQWANGLPLSRNSVRNQLMVIESIMKHAGRTVRFDKPPRTSRGECAVIPEPVYHKAIGSARGDLRAMLVVLWETGARPGELRLLTAEQVDWPNGVATMANHKTAHATGRKRVIPLSAEALKVLAGQREKHGGGLLFRTRAGTAYTLTGLTQAVWRVAGRIGHPELTAYGFRHTWATRALVAGVPDTHVAAVMGHSGTAMVHKHYSHLSSNARLLRDVVDRLSEGRKAG